MCGSLVQEDSTNVQATCLCSSVKRGIPTIVGVVCGSPIFQKSNTDVHMTCLRGSMQRCISSPVELMGGPCGEQSSTKLEISTVCCVAQLGIPLLVCFGSFGETMSRRIRQRFRSVAGSSVDRISLDQQLAYLCMFAKTGKM